MLNFLPESAILGISTFNTPRLRNRVFRKTENPDNHFAGYDKKHKKKLTSEK